MIVEKNKKTLLRTYKIYGCSAYITLQPYILYFKSTSYQEKFISDPISYSLSMIL